MTGSTVPFKCAAEVAHHNYVAAEAYVSLKLGEDAVAKAVQRLQEAPDHFA
jgi:hypothetical protein